MLDRAVDQPVQLGQDLVGLGLGLAQAEDLLEQPRVPERSAREHHRGGARSLVGGHDLGWVCKPPVSTTGASSEATSFAARS